MNKRIKIVVCILLLAFLGLAGYFYSVSNAETKNNAAGKKVLCRLAYTSKGYYAPQFIAARKGWFNSDTVLVEEVKLGMSAGIMAAEALVSGSADIAAMGDVPALICFASKRDCVLLSAFIDGERMHSLIAGKDSGIESPADLAGKRVGVQFGSSTHGAIYQYLRHNNIDPETVDLVNMPQKDQVEALISGSIAALVASEPTPTLALAKVEGAYQVASLSGLGNDYPLMLLASREFAQKYPEAVSLVLSGTAKADSWINSDPKAAAKLTSTMTGLSPEIEETMFGKMEWEMRLDESVVKSLETTAQFLYSIGKLKTIPDVRKHLYLAPSGK